MDKDFLLGTKYCDLDNADIQAKAREITSLLNGDEVRLAIEIFNWVRDEVKYSFDFWNVKASQTMRKMEGMCANKANLQIALLRAVGIPAKYGLFRIKKSAIRAIATDELYEKSSDIIMHVYCCVFLNGQWIGIDATVDKELYESAYIGVPGWEYRKWDGRSHLLIPDSYIVSVLPPKANIDEYMDMPSRFLTRDIIDRANSYIAQLRAKARVREVGPLSGKKIQGMG